MIFHLRRQVPAFPFKGTINKGPLNANLLTVEWKKNQPPPRKAVFQWVHNNFLDTIAKKILQLTAYFEVTPSPCPGCKIQQVASMNLFFSLGGFPEEKIPQSQGIP